MARSLPALTVAAFFALTATAGAHSLLRIVDGEAVYVSADEVSLNTLTVTASGGEIAFRDPTAYQGTDIGDVCRPGDVSDDANAYILEAFCAAPPITRVTADLGNREDTATVTPGVPSKVLGGEGADTLTTGDTGDTLDGGPGNDQLNAGGGADVVTGGAGVDTIDAGAGDDDIRVRDGLADGVSCGPGSARVAADSLDAVAGDCEVVTRTSTAAPPDAAQTATDKTPPVVDVGATTLQRLGSRGAIKVVGTSSERGALGASGYVDIAGLQLPLGNVSKPIAVPGAGAELTLKLTKAQLREARKQLKRKRKVTVFLSVVATDAAGNSASKRAPRIRVRA
jgi:hypothetical protein